VNESNHASASEPTIDEYVDGVLTPEQAAAFEARMTNDPELAAEVTLQRKIDDALGREFAYVPVARSGGASVSETESPGDVLARISPALSEERVIQGRRVIVVKNPNAPALPVEKPAEPAARNTTRRNVLFALAASLALAATYALWPREELNIIAPDEVYRRLVATGWTPDFVCSSDAEFIAAVEKRLSMSVLIPMATVGVRLDGWGYSTDYGGTPVGKSTMYLMATVGEKPVLVLMERASRDRADVALSNQGKNALHLFRRRVGGVVLYEVTPWAEERVIPAAVKP
jgi:anti-sigma factor RsiW